MIKRRLIDCITLVGRTPQKYEGEKVYVSTGAVDRDHIDYEETERVTYEGRPSRANLAVENGDVIFAKMCATEKTLLINSESEKFIYSTGFCAVRANSKVLSTECLYHLLTSEQFLWQKDVNCSGATQKAITNAGLSKIYIGIPSLDEQRELTTVLDLINYLIGLHREEIFFLDSLVKSRFIEMFGDPIMNERSWVQAPLSFCVDSIDNGKSFVCDAISRQGDWPAVLKLSAATYGYYRPEENKAMLDNKQFVEEAAVHAGDLLFTRKNTPELVGMCAYVYDTPNKLMMPDLIFRLNTNKRCNKVFLWKLINHDLFRDCIQAIATGSAKSMSNISKERLLSLEIILPPIELQEQFATFVQEVDKSRFIEMFGDPVDNPFDWPTKSLMSMGYCKNGMNFHMGDKGIDIHCLGVGDFKDLSVIDGTDDLPLVSLNEQPPEECLLKDDDIVFVRSNGNKALVGRCLAVYPHNVPTTYSGFCIRYRRTGTDVETQYLLRVLKMESMRKLMTGRGANIQNLNQQILAALDIPIPPLDIQADFAAFVQATDKSKYYSSLSLECCRIVANKYRQEWMICQILNS